MPTTLLDHFRTRSQVDCDTLDQQVASSLGPFVDCTSNQAIAYLELIHTQHADLLKKASAIAKYLAAKEHDIPIPTLAVDIAMILLALPILPHLSGCMHIQVNPLHSYSTWAIIANAERIYRLFQHIVPEFSPSRICIKIPSTWEGLQACRILESKNIKTLATTLFSMEQAALAGKYNCTYIAPYVNELRVHFDHGYKDEAPNFQLCVDAQRYYAKHGQKTMVLPASLTSIEECMKLAGAGHITISPPLLSRLADTYYDKTTYPSLYDVEAVNGSSDIEEFDDLEVEEKFRLAFTRRDDGRQEVKLVQAINIFCDFQMKLEKMMEVI